MKTTMKITRENLLRATNILSLITQRPGIPASQYIRISTKKKSLVSLSLSSDALCRVELPIAEGRWPYMGSFFVDRNTFFPWVNTARDGSRKDFEFSVEESPDGVLMVLKQGLRRSTFLSLPDVTGYGSLEIASKNTHIVKLTNDQKEIIQCAEYCATTDPIAPQLNCVYLTKMGIVMSSNQLIIFRGKSAKFERTLPMPLYLLGLLSLDGLDRIVYSKKQVVLKLDCAEILQSVPQHALKRFPVDKVNALVRAEYPKQFFTVDGSKLAEVLRHFATYMASVRKQDKVVSLVVRAGKKNMTVESKVSTESFRESLRMKTIPKEDALIEWSLDTVMPVIAFLGHKKKTISVSGGEGLPHLLSSPPIWLVIARKVS